MSLAEYERERIKGGHEFPTTTTTVREPKHNFIFPSTLDLYAYGKLIDKLEDLLDIHRAKAHICCDETCLCWDIEELVLKERA